MRKTLTFILAALMIFAMIPSIAVGATDAATVGASLDVAKVGKVADADTLKAEYAAAGWTAIDSVEDFQAISTTEDGGNYYLTADITVADGEKLYPMTEGEAGLITGPVVLDGCGHTISGINQEMAIFSMQEKNAASASLEVKNLIIEDAVVNTPADIECDGQAQAPGILTNNVYKHNFTVDNVYLSGELKVVGGSTSFNGMGLIAGYMPNGVAPVITNTYVTGSLNYDTDTAEQDINIGGIVGRIDNTSTRIENCIADVNITALGGNGPYPTSYGVGGITGMIHNNMTNPVLNCTVRGTIDGGAYAAGGFVGILRTKNSAFAITNCLNESTVKSDLCAGGMIGRMFGQSSITATITNSVNEGDVVAVGLTAKADGITNKEAGTLNTDETVVSTGTVKTELGLDEGATRGFISATAVDAGTQKRNVRFILALDAAAMANASYTLTVTFTPAEGAAISKSTTVVTGFNGLIAGGVEYSAADGVVLCGLEITGVPEAAWESITVTFDADADALDFNGSALRSAL